MAFACQQFEVSERRACKLMGVDGGSYRYEPRPDRKAESREALIALARQKPRYESEVHALLLRHYHPQRDAHLPALSSRRAGRRRLKRKRLSRVTVASHWVRSNQEWALDFAWDTLATGRGIRVLAVVDGFTRENLSSKSMQAYRAVE